MKLLLFAPLLVLGCKRTDAVERVADLRGAGATFPYPLYRAWFSEYATRMGVRINYFSVGSAEGMRLLQRGEAEFGAVDSPESPVPLRPDSTCAAIAIPTVAGPIAIAYNLPQLPSNIPLRMDAALLAAIYRGRVHWWDDRDVLRLNEGRRLPHLKVTVVHRAHGSGTSRAFIAFLRDNHAWNTVDSSTTDDVQWPVGISAEGNEGQASEVKVTVGAIGYVELAYARQNRLAVAAVRNIAGNFIVPGADAPEYPLTTRTWLVVEPARLTPDKGKPLVAFIRWALHDGAAQAHDYEYLSLSPDTVARYDSLVSRLDFTRCQQH